MPPRHIVTTAIPYVNGDPHVGHALELVQTDVIARHLRQSGPDGVWAQTGTDDNALKNVLSAQAEGLDTGEYVAAAALRFRDLNKALGADFDCFLETSRDPRHLPGVQNLWLACSRRGDLYQKTYSGLYCVGCEAFYPPPELIDGNLCPEHLTPVEEVHETNWFFRLSAYQDELLRVVESGEVMIHPPHRRNEVLSFVRSGLDDFSVSRSIVRTRGWGIPVPGDPEQVVYVWFDALANYITGPGFDLPGEHSTERGWNDAGTRTHVIGKGIIRFHAVYWPAMLLSAGLPLPTRIMVHEYLTADGRKIGKSTGGSVAPSWLTERYGTDALRWWLLREVASTGDTDFTQQRLVDRYNQEIVNTIGNLVNRVATMVHKYRPGDTFPVDPAPSAELREIWATVGEALAQFDLRLATQIVVDHAATANQLVTSFAPWKLAKAEAQGADREALNHALHILIAHCRDVAWLLRPFVPPAAERIEHQIGRAVIPAPMPLFPRLEP